MKLRFSKTDLEKFKSLLNIKKFPSDIEKGLINKTAKYIRLVKWIPGLQMIAIGNSVAMNGANENSDIDLFIITSPNRLWIVRIFITFIFQVLKVRKTKKNHKARFCLSFFSTTNSLCLKDIAIKNDIYLYFWMIFLKPILSYNNTYEKFIDDNEKWSDLNDYNSIIEDNKKYIVYKKNTSKYNCILLTFLEKIFKLFFLPKTKRNSKKLGNPFGVIINDNMLKFHDKDKRKKIRDKIIN